MTMKIAQNRLMPIVDGLVDMIRPHLEPKHYINTHEMWNDGPAITIGRADLRYALITFKSEGPTRIKIRQVIFAKWYIPEISMIVDITEPGSLEKVAAWIVVEIPDALKRGWSGRQEKRTPNPSTVSFNV